MSKNLLYGSLIGLAVFISALALSTYGLGKEEHDRGSDLYQTASSFTMISVTGTVISLIILVIAILLLPNPPKLPTTPRVM